MYNAVSNVKIYAWITATSISIRYIKLIKRPDAGTTTHILNINMSSSRLNIIMCPPIIAANRRIVRANGFVNNPKNSTGANISITGFGTPGIDTISFQ
jgi:hypothetical protein